MYAYYHIIPRRDSDPVVIADFFSPFACAIKGLIENRARAEGISDGLISILDGERADL